MKFVVPICLGSCVICKFQTPGNVSNDSNFQHYQNCRIRTGIVISNHISLTKTSRKKSVSYRKSWKGYILGISHVLGPSSSYQSNPYNHILLLGGIGNQFFCNLLHPQSMNSYSKEKSSKRQTFSILSLCKPLKFRFF